MSGEPSIPSGSRSIMINASLAQVWAEVGDIDGLGVHSPETVRTEWLADTEGPSVGAVFKGHNALGGFEWTTECTIIRFVENEVFSFGVDWEGHAGYSSVWTYGLAEHDGATRLTESYESAYLASPEQQTRGGRQDVLAGAIEETLQRIKIAVEGEPNT